MIGHFFILLVAASALAGPVTEQKPADQHHIEEQQINYSLPTDKTDSNYQKSEQPEYVHHVPAQTYAVKYVPAWPKYSTPVLPGFYRNYDVPEYLYYLPTYYLYRSASPVKEVATPVATVFQIPYQSQEQVRVSPSQVVPAYAAQQIEKIHHYREPIHFAQRGSLLPIQVVAPFAYPEVYKVQIQPQEQVVQKTKVQAEESHQIQSQATGKNLELTTQQEQELTSASTVYPTQEQTVQTPGVLKVNPISVIKEQSQIPEKIQSFVAPLVSTIQEQISGHHETHSVEKKVTPQESVTGQVLQVPDYVQQQVQN